MTETNPRAVSRTIRELSEGLPVTNLSGDPRRIVRSIDYDSRLLERDGLFVAIRGYQTDGHRFIPEVWKKGAAGVVYDTGSVPPESGGVAVRVPDSRKALPILANNFYGYPSRQMRLVGITGTNGKTTTNYLVQSVFRAANMKTGLIGTIEWRVDGESIPAVRTTPESTDLQKALFDMSLLGVQAVSLEVTSHALVLDRVKGCRFSTCVFTNLSGEHLDFHGDLETYFEAKKLLFTEYAPGWSVLNGDDPWGLRIAGRLGGKNVLLYGLKPNNAVTAEDVRLNPTDTWFTAKTPFGDVPVRSSLIGSFNVQNLLAAVSVGLAEGIPPETVTQGILRCTQVAGRFQWVNEGQNFSVIVDYAHTDDALDKVLTAARVLTRGRLILVFGCGGDRDRGKRPRMGKIAVEKSDHCVVTSDNPRTEDPDKIIQDVLSGMANRNLPGKRNFTVIPDRNLAIEHAVFAAEAGDVVLIAGKGHEKVQIIGTERIPFDDVETARFHLHRRQPSKSAPPF